jgi:hypothetical protein
MRHTSFNSSATVLVIFTLGLLLSAAASPVLLAAEHAQPGTRRLLYVATPGVRNYLEYGGHGLVVFDMDNGHKFVKRIKTAGLNESGEPLNVKGVCASTDTKRIYITTPRSMHCLDLLTEKVLWEKPYPGGCDRMAIAPDGKLIYVPSFEGPTWNVVDGLSGDVIAKLTPNSGAHNTVYGLDGSRAYLGGLKSPLLRVADTKTHTIAKEVGPFGNSIRPFTVNGRQTLCFICVNELLGFEVGDLTTGKMLHRVEVQGFQKGAVKRHGCPSHGVGLTPDEKEVWVVDAHNKQLHIFDASPLPAAPPKQVKSIAVRDEPGWITFSLDGKLAYPSTGDVIEVATRQIITGLKDEKGVDVQSEKMVEIHFKDGQPVRVGDQFGVGRVTK